MRDAVWKISASEKGTRLTMLAITEARQIFKRVGHTNPHPMSHAQSRIFMQGTRNSPIAPALLVTLVEKKGTMPNSAPSQGIQPQSRTTTAIIQRPNETISIPTITTGSSSEPCNQRGGTKCSGYRTRYVSCQHNTCNGFV